MTKNVFLVGISMLLAAFAFVRWQAVQEATESSKLNESNHALISKKENNRPFGITFPDGERIPVTLRRLPPMLYPTGVTSLADEYGRLVEDALNGNVATAHYLYKSLRECSKPDFINEADLEAGIAEFYEHGAYTRSDGSNVVNSRALDPDPLYFEESLREAFALCDGVDQRLLLDKDRWRKFAIERGHFSSVSLYASSLPRTSPERVAMNKKAFELGLIYRALQVAVAYQNGLEGQEPDLVQAYAYAYLHAKLLEPATSKEYREKADDILFQIGITMSIYQMDEALALAKEILVNSPGCCFGEPSQN